MKSGNFFAELKRRNVYKVAVAYAVVAWLVIQIASIVLPTFHAPEWTLQVIIALVVIGFPVALICSWAFEITPEGIVRESEVERQRCYNPAHRSEDCRHYHRACGCGDGIVRFSTVARAPGKRRAGRGERPAGCRDRAACHSVTRRSSAR